MTAIFKLVKSIDWFVVIAVMVLMTIGVLFIYSSGINSSGELVSTEYVRQIVWVISGLILILATTMIEPKRLPDYTTLIYGFTALMLIYTKLFGKVVNGARSWLGIGDFGIQPSEFMKIATMLFLAKYLESSRHEGSTIKRFVISCGIVLFPMILILSQPDFGTALVFLPIYLAMAFVGGINRRFLVFISLFGAIAIVLTIVPLWQNLVTATPSLALRLFYDAPYVYYVLGVIAGTFTLALLGLRVFKKRYYYWIAFFSSIFGLGIAASLAGHKFLKGYQLMRLVVFLDPGIDPLGAGRSEERRVWKDCINRRSPYQ